MIITIAEMQLCPCCYTYAVALHLSLLVATAVGFIHATMTAQCEQSTSLLPYMLIPIANHVHLSIFDRIPVKSS